MRFLELTPLDVFTVRDSRPFDVGGIVHASGVWPPPPWTILGALRGLMVETLGFSVTDYARISTNNDDLKELVARVGPPDGAAAFAIGPALLAEKRKRLRWPVPADLLSYEETSNGSTRRYLRRLRGVERTALPGGAFCSLPEARSLLLLPPADEALHAQKGLSVRAFGGGLLDKWLSGEERIDLDSVPRAESGANEGSDLAWEPRIGIQLEPERHVVREGRFYVRQVMALGQDRSILVPLVQENGLPWDDLNPSGSEGTRSPRGV